MSPPNAARVLKRLVVKKMSDAKTLKVTLVKSVHGRLPNHKLCVKGLGLRRINHTVEVIDTPENRGMINKVHYLLDVQE